MSRPTVPPIARIMRRIRISTVDGCWEWSGAKSDTGYGVIWDNPAHRIVRTHRATYEHFVGPVPDGLDLDHLCRNRACCNPAHLEPVTRAENIRRGLRAGALGRMHAAKTHCPKGHEYAGENLYIHPTNGSRNCRMCRAEQAAARRARTAVAA